MQTNRFAAILACAALIAGLAACSPAPGDNPSGQSAPSDPSASGKIKISVPGKAKENDPAQKAVVELRTQQMAEKYPNIEIEFVDWAYDVNTFLPKAASGQLPTLYTTFFTEANKIISQGFARDITDETQKWGYDTALNPAMLDVFSRDGRIYGLPTDGYALGMWYNVELFRQAGLVDADGYPTLPKNSDELRDMAVTIKQKTGQAGYFFPTQNNNGGWFFSQLAWTFGAEFIETDANGKYKAVFDSPEAIEALTWLKDMKWKYDVLQPNVLVTIDEEHKLWALDQCAIGIGELGQTSGAISNYKANKDHFAMGPIVPGANAKGRQIALLGGNLFCVAPNATPEQVTAGFQYMEVDGYSSNLSDAVLKAMEDKWKVSAENGRIVGPQGIRVWVDKARLQKENDAIAKYANVDMKLFTPFTDTLNDNSIPLHPEHPVYCQELYKMLDASVQAVLTDESVDPAQLLKTAATDFQRDYLDKANAGQVAN